MASWGAWAMLPRFLSGRASERVSRATKKLRFFEVHLAAKGFEAKFITRNS